MVDDFNHMIVEMKTYYNNIVETKRHNGEQKYTDLNDFLTTKYPVAAPEKLTEFAHKLQDLYDKCCSVKDVVRESQSQVYPGYTTSSSTFGN